MKGLTGTVYTKSINHVMNAESGVSCQISCQDFVLLDLNGFTGQYDCAFLYKT